MSPAAKRPFSRTLVITVAKGGQRLWTKAFDQGPVVIGRQPDCDLILEFPFVSRTHCQIEESREGFLLVDLNSRNGSIIDGRPVRSVSVEDSFSFLIQDISLSIKFVGEPKPVRGQDNLDTIFIPSKKKPFPG